MCDSHGSVDQTPTESLGSDCNAGEQQTAETQMRVCSIKLVDCRNPKETIEEATAEKEKSDNDDGNCDDDADFNPLGMFQSFNILTGVSTKVILKFLKLKVLTVFGLCVQFHL